MATSGYFYTSGYSDSGWPDRWLFEWTLSSQSTEGNYSVISWSLKGYGGSSVYRYTTVHASYVNVNGSEYSSDSTQDVYNNTVRHSGTATIYHNSDGTKSFSASAKGAFYYTYYNSSGFGSWDLPTIPRASSVSCSTADIGSNATITINRASSSFTHTLTYSFGSLTGTIATKTSSTSISWTIPTTFYSQIPNAASGAGTITCQTYNGSTLIGSKSTTFTATVNESASKPTLSPTVSDSNSITTALTGDSSKFIKYFSNASVATGAKARNSATLLSYNIACGPDFITTASGTINTVKNSSFTFSVTDSRGYTTTQTLNKTLIEYIKLTCSMEASAPSTAGVATLQISGNYWDGSFGKVANTLTVEYRYKTQGGTYGDWTAVTATKSDNTYNATATISGLDYQTTYVFQARALDKLIAINTNEQTRRTTPIFDWGKDDFNVNGTLKINNKNIFDLIYPVGAIYISVNATSPEVLFGGTWEQIKDVFLLGCSLQFNPLGSTGGEASHTLTIEEMPAHGHTLFYDYSSGIQSFGYQFSRKGERSDVTEVSSGIGNTGGSKPHNNMPPYLAVAMWKRTA